MRKQISLFGTTAIMVGFFLNLIGVQVDHKLFPYPIINQIFADALDVFGLVLIVVGSINFSIVLSKN